MSRPHPSHIYSRIYRTARGQKRTLYYVRFKTWQGHLLRLPADDKLSVAIRLRDFLRGLNTQKYDFLKDPQNALGKRTDLPETAETLQKWVERFLALKRAKRSLGKDKRMSTRLLDFFTGGVVPKSLTAITTAKIEDYKLLRSQQPDHRGMLPKPATINREISLLRSILRMAQDQDALTKLPKIRLLTEHNERHRTASRAEYLKLLDAVKHRGEVVDVLEILWEQGLRENEVVSLRWPQVDLANQVFVFPPLSTKEKNARRPPMSPRVAKILTRRAKNAKGQWVFTTSRGNRLRQGWFNRLVARGMSKAGITGLWIHDLRGTFITRKILDEGYDRKLVKAVTGHATDYAFDRYLRPSLEHQREMMRGRKRYETATQSRNEEHPVDN